MIFINHTEVLDSRVAVVKIEGPLDSSTSPDFEDYINQLLDKNIRFILFDAKKMEYVSSEGIGLTLFLQKKISEDNGFFIIFDLSDEIMTLYNLLGFDKIFRMADSRAEAMQIMDRQIELRGSSEFEELQKESDDNLDTENNFKEIESGNSIGVRDKDAHDFIVECNNCKSLVRVKKIGDYICPECNTIFSVMDEDDNESKFEKSVRDDAEFNPLIIECANCKALIRVNKSGDFKCPECNEKFIITGDQSAIF